MALTAVNSKITKSGNAIEIYKGQSKDIEVDLTQPGIDPRTNLPADVSVDLAGAVMYCSVRSEPGNPILLIKKVSTDVTQISFTAPTTSGVAVIHFGPLDTYKLEADTYVFDVWVVLSGGKTYPVIEVSEFIVKQPVTIIAG
jgi:hypothetical protein